MSDITPKSQRRRGKVHHSIVVSSFLLPVGDVSTYGRGTQDPNTAADLLHGGWSGRSVQCRWRYRQGTAEDGRRSQPLPPSSCTAPRRAVLSDVDMTWPGLVVRATVFQCPVSCSGSWLDTAL
ncbi:hypothetical protein LSAT2_028871, partial [Lamellibrachia satsuma]